MNKFRFPFFFNKQLPRVANTKQIVDLKTGKTLDKILEEGVGGSGNSSNNSNTLKDTTNYGKVDTTGGKLLIPNKVLSQELLSNLNAIHTMDEATENDLLATDAPISAGAIYCAMLNVDGGNPQGQMALIYTLLSASPNGKYILPSLPIDWLTDDSYSEYRNYIKNNNDTITSQSNSGGFKSAGSTIPVDSIDTHCAIFEKKGTLDLYAPKPEIGGWIELSYEDYFCKIKYKVSFTEGSPDIEYDNILKYDCLVLYHNDDLYVVPSRNNDVVRRINTSRSSVLDFVIASYAQTIKTYVDVCEGGLRISLAQLILDVPLMVQPEEYVYSAHHALITAIAGNQPFLKYDNNLFISPTLFKTESIE